jgi:Zn ribbon nucleic-acid-binding protein
MSNINCLKGMRCPSCKNQDEILVRARMWVSLNDDGTDPYADSTSMCGDVDYDNDADARCPECGHEGALREWCAVNQKRTKKLNVRGT